MAISDFGWSLEVRNVIDFQTDVMTDVSQLSQFFGWLSNIQRWISSNTVSLYQLTNFIQDSS